MMKKILLLIFLAMVGTGGFYSYQAYNYPFQKYQKWIRGEDFDEWFFVPNFSQSGFNNQLKSIERNVHRGKDAESLWKTFHVTNVLLPLPFRHPLFSVVPILQDQGKENEPMIGFEFLNNQQKKIFSIEFLPDKEFKFVDNKQKLFALPIFKQDLDSISEKQKWKDMFEMQFQDQPDALKKMVYKLYILDQRMSYLTKLAKTFGYIPGIDAAVIEFTGKDKDFKDELILYLKGRVVYSFHISYKLGEPEARAIRSRILRELKIEPDSENMAKIIYEEFKVLPYKQQVSNDGLIYLFSAWSHTPNDKEFFRVMVQFLERGIDNFIFLEPLYSYGYNRFGSSFSRIDSRLKEKAEEEFRRKLEEEEKKDIKEIMNKKIEDINLNDLTDQQRIDYQLKKAKEKNANSSDDKSIIVD
jgi:hypothetical protein